MDRRRIERLPVDPSRGRFRALARVRQVASRLSFLVTWATIAWVSVPPVTDAGERQERCAAAAPLRIANLSPFHIPYAAPASFGACALAPGETEAIVSMDMASHMLSARSGSESLALDGETWRPSLTLRHGVGDGWDYTLEVAAVSHGPGVFDGFIEGWHSTFDLPQGGRDTTPRDRLRISHARDGRGRVDIDRAVSSAGDLTLGIGRALGPSVLSNDGLALRAAVRLPTGDEDALAGAGGLSAALWAETSGQLWKPDWLYGAAAGALAAKPPRALSGVDRGFVLFARLGATWRPLADLALSVQADVATPPYRSSLAPLGGPSILFGMGGRLRLAPRATLEIAVTEDDGWRRAAPDIGLHAAIRWHL
ncbi:MAG: DUF3187 family protein [Defluviicoccus sp.]|nr:DUF3187 family protein [Defluviicoccus sp.]MDE0278559.1 DUF3187 family protein [Defluviicoccus sp.]